MRRLIISLFDYSGNWPRYFGDDSKYEVVQVDIKHGDNILTWKPPRTAYGVLAALPCTDFAGSGARWWADKDRDGRTAESLRLLARTMDIITRTSPKFWMLENPVGRLKHYMGRPAHMFHPYQYAGYSPSPEEDRYTKRTCLWGWFDMPAFRPLDPVMYRTADGKQGSWQWAKLGGKSERTKTLRSLTPMGFAKATYLGNRA